ncbi:MAG: acyl-CoA-binding protein [Salinisphaera sp.]|jgi:diazepam-binding inhibitor (GABA receptor modulating acyl-CoA-binding protein)|nr:acyl-CoA-binding protein [Salinisphaera sp.]
MTDIKADFEQAQKDAKTLSSRPANNDLLALYAHYKQATRGDIEGKRPGMTDFKGRAKYDAWARLKGLDSETAMDGYVTKVQSLLAADR